MFLDIFCKKTHHTFLIFRLKWIKYTPIFCQYFAAPKIIISNYQLNFACEKKNSDHPCSITINQQITFNPVNFEFWIPFISLHDPIDQFKIGIIWIFDEAQYEGQVVSPKWYKNIEWNLDWPYYRKIILRYQT